MGHTGRHPAPHSLSKAPQFLQKTGVDQRKNREGSGKRCEGSAPLRG